MSSHQKDYDLLICEREKKLDIEYKLTHFEINKNRCEQNILTLGKKVYSLEKVDLMLTQIKQSSEEKNVLEEIKSKDYEHWTSVDIERLMSIDNELKSHEEKKYKDSIFYKTYQIIKKGD